MAKTRRVNALKSVSKKAAKYGVYFLAAFRDIMGIKQKLNSAFQSYC